MAIRLPKPKKAQSLPPIEPSFDNMHQVNEMQADEIIETEAGTSFVTLTELHEGFNNRRFFDWHGRVSRVQFLAYSTFNALIALMLVALLFVMIGGFQGIVNLPNPTSMSPDFSADICCSELISTSLISKFGCRCLTVEIISGNKPYSTEATNPIVK